MIRCPLRVLCLVAAGWALLFAPGAVSEEISTSGSVVDPDRVTAAVLAPTLDHGAVLGVRPLTSRQDDARLIPNAAVVPVVALAVVMLAATWRTASRASYRGFSGFEHCRVSRGPPRV